ncbi:hypothetical protein MWN33_14335 [Starkeya koreensis]|uniref:Uncharacterized protein n=1 Tax=Ancylobacter koreensis TaxID=266121 RepID=A0ABT0DPM4_9HYPH|nr:hypothetical protein [Ancylobacter koreensis]MCK0209210.1 hypothetical protein [Ancylobacter koreensis]
MSFAMSLLALPTLVLGSLPSLSPSPFATVAAMYVVGCAGLVLVAFDAAADTSEDE